MIISGIANTFLLESLMGGIHLPGDDYRIALYLESAVLSESTEKYVTEGETNGPGYTPGGMSLKGRRTLLDGRVAILTWDNPVWPVSTIKARGALIYNRSRANRAVAVVDLGEDYASKNGDFIVKFPIPSATTALIRIG